MIITINPARQCKGQECQKNWVWLAGLVNLAINFEIFLLNIQNSPMARVDCDAAAMAGCIDPVTHMTRVQGFSGSALEQLLVEDKQL